MTKKAIIIRSVIAGILTAISAFFIWCIVDCVYNMLYVDWGGLAIITLVVFLFIAIPVVAFVIIFQIIMISKKKFFIVDFIASVIFFLSWASLYIVPLIISSTL